MRGKDSTWNLEDESVYGTLYDDIYEAMKHAERMCNIKSPRYAMDKVIGTINTFYPILGRADCTLWH
jgi:hypothetical protein